MVAPADCRFSGLELWCVDLEACGPALRDIENQTPRLSPFELGRAEDVRDKAVAAQWLAAHVALRILLERAAGTQWRGVPFERSHASRPHAKGAPIEFSLSHAPGHALIGLATGSKIGVDLETTRKVRVDSARRAQMEHAARVLNAGQPLPAEADRRFLQAWVRLEALAKADGRGIGHLLTQLGVIGAPVEDEGAQDRTQFLLNYAPGLQVTDLALGNGFFAAAALPRARTSAEVHALPHSVSGLEGLIP